MLVFWEMFFLPAFLQKKFYVVQLFWRVSVFVLLFPLLWLLLRYETLLLFYRVEQLILFFFGNVLYFDFLGG